MAADNIISGAFSDWLNGYVLWITSVYIIDWTITGLILDEIAFGKNAGVSVKRFGDSRIYESWETI